MLLFTHGCALSLCLWWSSSALDTHFPSTTVRNAGVKCVSWGFRCSAERMWGGKEGVKGEEHHLSGNFLGIYFSKINCKVPECFPLPTLDSPGRAPLILLFDQKSV